METGVSMPLTVRWGPQTRIKDWEEASHVGIEKNAPEGEQRRYKLTEHPARELQAGHQRRSWLPGCSEWGCVERGKVRSCGDLRPFIHQCTWLLGPMATLRWVPCWGYLNSVGGSLWALSPLLYSSLFA